MNSSNPLNRAIRILEIVASAGNKISLTQVSAIADLAPSTTLRILTNLVSSDLLHFDSAEKLYTLGARAERMAGFIIGDEWLDRMVEPSVRALSESVEETSFFVGPGRDGLRLVQCAVPTASGRPFVHPGFDFPMSRTASGKVFEAFAISAPDEPKSLTEEARGKVRHSGYAFNVDEYEVGISSIAAPVFLEKRLCGALSIIFTTDRLPKEKTKEREKLISTLTSSAQNLSEILTTVPRSTVNL